MSESQSNAELAFALARENLGAFIQLMDPTYEIAQHHEAIIKQLMRGEAGLDRRLIFQAPPRHGKSHTTSILFPAWYLGRHPNRKLISASCTQDLANDFGAKVRNLIQDPRFQAIFPECRLSADMQAKDHFRLTAGGEYFAVGRGSTTVGRGANCLVAGTLVRTELGDVPIESVAPGMKVLSYDEKSSRCEFQRVAAVSARPATRVRRVSTGDGRVVESTPDHPIYVAGRYVEARALTGGDRLLCSVLQDGLEGGARDHEAREAWADRLLLLKCLLGAFGERAAVWAQGVCALWGASAAQFLFGYEQGAVLQPSLFVAGAGGAQSGNARGVAPADLWAMWGGVPDRNGQVQLGEEARGGAFLWSLLRGQGALAADVPRWQSEVEGRRDWDEAAPLLRKGFSGDSSSHHRAGWGLLRRLSLSLVGLARTPHRQRSDEQCPGELGNALREASSRVARGEGFGVKEDAVAVVKDLCRDVVVYDIEVERNHNFFANGILVHNCFIVDDPTKDKIEARSATVQNDMYDWFSTVARTRLEPPNLIIVVETLWSEAGLSAWLPRSQKRTTWKLTRFPAIAEGDEFDAEGNLWRKKGEPLWPSRFPLTDLEEIRDGMRTDDWMCLFQQRATSDEGNFFKRQWLENSYLDKPTSGDGMNRYIVVDPATSKKRASDFTTAWVVGLGPDHNFYILDAVRDKLSLTERADMLFKLHGRWFPIINVGYEEYGMQADIQHIRYRQEQQNYHFTITPLGGIVRKEDRIADLEPLFRQHRIRMPRSLWYQPVDGSPKVDLIKPFLEEYSSFSPQGGTAAHDDMLDSLARITDRAMSLDWPMTQQQMERRAQAARIQSGKGSWMAA